MVTVVVVVLLLLLYDEFGRAAAEEVGGGGVDSVRAGAVLEVYFGSTAGDAFCCCG